MGNDEARPSAYVLRNPIQRYAWGSSDAIPAILGTGDDGKPCAELWMGAHPQAPSRTFDRGAEVALGELIAAAPAHFLGDAAGDALPFLLKLLSAASPLSIQAHPSREQAARGFDREEAAGLPADSPDRLYRDRNHKPEIIAALGPFDALCGFRPRSEIAKNLSLLEGEDGALDGLVALSYAIAASEEGLRDFFAAHLAVDGEERVGLVEGARKAARRRLDAPGLGEGARIALETMIRLSEFYPADPGVLAALYLNVVRLDRLDALFIPHGILHAYLKGTGVELMASSDNVLRGGLTPKKVDPGELASVLSFDPYAPEIRRPAPADPSGWSPYAAPCADFSLAVLDGEREARRSGALPEIVFCVEGSFSVGFGGEAFDLPRGASIFVPARSGPYRVSGRGLAFRASPAR